MVEASEAEEREASEAKANEAEARVASVVRLRLLVLLDPFALSSCRSAIRRRVSGGGGMISIGGEGVGGAA